jgi:hypothetical protein
MSLNEPQPSLRRVLVIIDDGEGVTALELSGDDALVSVVMEMDDEPAVIEVDERRYIAHIQRHLSIVVEGKPRAGAPKLFTLHQLPAWPEIPTPERSRREQ